MAEEQRKAITEKWIDITKALDCSQANAKTVLGYYREGVTISLPVEKYLMFFHWIRYDLFYKATTIEQVVSNRHIAEKSGDTVYFRCTFNEKKAGK